MIKSIKTLDNIYYNVYASRLAYEKMKAYTDICVWEIGWFGYVSKVEGLGFLVEDVYLLKQDAHATTTEIHPEATLEHFSLMTAEQVSKNRLWGHSHVNMGVTPSGQDESQAKEHYADCEDFYIRLIMNKKEEFHITVYDMERKLEVVLDSLPVYEPEILEMRLGIAEEIKEKVSYKTSTIKTGTARTGTVTYGYGAATKDSDYSYYYTGYDDKDEYNYGYVGSWNGAEGSEYYKKTTPKTQGVRTMTYNEMIGAKDYKSSTLEN
jgi:hypothetical protein